MHAFEYIKFWNSSCMPSVCGLNKGSLNQYCARRLSPRLSCYSLRLRFFRTLTRDCHINTYRAAQKRVHSFQLTGFDKLQGPGLFVESSDVVLALMLTPLTQFEKIHMKVESVSKITL